MSEIISLMQSSGQEHLLKFYGELTDEQKILFDIDVKDVDWLKLDQIYKEQVATQIKDGKLKPASKINNDSLEPLPSDCIGGTTRCEQSVLDNYRKIGLTSICQGKVAALLLAGGQGTRLGVSYPKGMYDVGLPTHKSLFQLQAERILKLSETSELAAGKSAPITWYIMTSEATMQMTIEFFESHNYFELDKENVVFFEQNNLPCFDFDGKVFLDKKYKISKSPDGNGGLYEALHSKGILNHMSTNGIEYVHVYCVDNILVKVCDPTFMGYCIDKGVDAGAKVVEKVSPNEAVGTICKVDNQFKVIEYSEIPDNIAQKRDSLTGKLAFNAGNICEHFFKVNFLETIRDNKKLPYHIAIKKIPHIDLISGKLLQPVKPNGIKLEKFIFDVFEFTNKFAAWEVKREDEFSPLKNAEGTEKDNPTTALKALIRSYELGILEV